MIKKKFLKYFIFFSFTSGIIFYSYFLSQNKSIIKINQKKDNITKENKKIIISSFKNVEYVTTNQDGKKYITKGAEANISKEKPEIIMLKDVYSFTTLKDGSKLVVRSKNAQYDKLTANIFYEGEVVITNKDIIIKSNYANYNKKKSLIELSENVLANDSKTLIKSDKATLNLLNKNIILSMNSNNERIYGKRKK